MEINFMVKATWIFRPEKLHRKKYVETSRFFNYRNYMERSTSKQRAFFDQRNYTDNSTWKKCGVFGHQNYIEKSTWKQRGSFNQQNYVEKSTWNRHGFFDLQNYIEKVRGNDVKFIEIGSSTYRHNIHVESTWIRRGVPVRKKQCKGYLELL